MKIVHAADLHIDSPVRGLDSYDAAPVDLLRVAGCRSLQTSYAAFQLTTRAVDQR